MGTTRKKDLIFIETLLRYKLKVTCAKKQVHDNSNNTNEKERILAQDGKQNIILIAFFTMRRCIFRDVCFNQTSVVIIYYYYYCYFVRLHASTYEYMIHEFNDLIVFSFHIMQSLKFICYNKKKSHFSARRLNRVVLFYLNKKPRFECYLGQFWLNVYMYRTVSMGGGQE